MIATRSRIAHNNSSVPVSIVVSAVVITKLLPRRGCTRVQTKDPAKVGLQSSPQSRKLCSLADDDPPSVQTGPVADRRSEALLTHSVQQGNPYRKDAKAADGGHMAQT